MSREIVGKTYVILTASVFGSQPKLDQRIPNAFMLAKHLRQFTFECVRHRQDRPHLRRRITPRKSRQKSKWRRCDLFFTLEVGSKRTFQLASGSSHLAAFCGRASEGFM